jgi:hypothetical protein
MLRLEAFQNPGQAAVQHGPGKPDGQAAGHALPHVVGVAGGLRRLVQQRAGGGNKGQPGGRQRDLLAAAREQPGADRRFQLLDVERQRRLRHREPARGTAKVQLFSQNQKVAQVSEFHKYR